MLTIIPHNEVPLRGFKWAFSWARRAEDVAPYHVFGMVRCVVGADVLGGPHGRVRPRRCPLGAARVPSVYRFHKKRTKMLHEGRFGLAPSTVL